MGQERCGLCMPGYFLDISTYACVQQCPPNSKAIQSTNVQSLASQPSGSNVASYCRPFANNTQYTYVYYVNPNSTAYLELGTYEYPFKNMDSPAKEVFNFMYERETVLTVYHLRGTSMKHYYGVMPIILLNTKMHTLDVYGDPRLPKPHVYITGHDYLWPDSSLYSVAETYYNLNLRVARGDMDPSESNRYFLKFNVFRSNL